MLRDLSWTEKILIVEGVCDNSAAELAFQIIVNKFLLLWKQPLRDLKIFL